MTITIIIPIYNHGYCIDKCLQALSLQAGIELVEIITVDDGSTDNTPDVLRTWEKAFQNFKIIQQRNAGPAAARNRGIQAAQGEIIIFLDSDCIPETDWLRNLSGPFMSDSNWAGVEGKTIPDADHVTPLHHYVENQKGGVYWTCNIAYRKTALLQVGGFDESFLYPAGEDIDLAYRIKKEGAIHFQSDAIVRHQLLERPIRKHLMAGRTFSSIILLWKKHPDLLTPEGTTFNNLVKYQFKQLIFPVYHMRSWLRKKPSVFLIFCFIRFWLVLDTIARLPHYAKESKTPLIIQEPLFDGNLMINGRMQSASTTD